MAADALAAAEREKYRRAWASPAYHNWSPGLDHAPLAHRLLDMKPGDLVNDYGCGDGKAARWFVRHGMQVTGIDIVDAITDVPDHFRFVESCLWDLPGGPAKLFAHFGFCCDVLEHLPEARCGEVIQAIADRTHTGMFLSIAHFRDHFGPYLGLGPLHLTVAPWSWWAELMPEGFEIIYHQTMDQTSLVALKRKH